MKFVKTFLLTSVSFGLYMGIFNSLINCFLSGYGGTGWLIGIKWGMIIGIIFGLFMAIYGTIVRSHFQRNRPDFSGEELLYEGPANRCFASWHPSAGEAGWLFLTNRRLLFRSFSAILRPSETNLHLRIINRAEPSRTAGIIPNGLRVFTVTGAAVHFVVEGRKQWSNAILQAKNHAV